MREHPDAPPLSAAVALVTGRVLLLVADLGAATGLALALAAIAHAQTPGHYGYKAPVASAQLNSDLGAKADAMDPALSAGAPGAVVVRLSAHMPIVNAPGAPVSPTYLGEPDFPLQRSMVTGHSQTYCDTLGWVDATGCLDVTANATQPYRNGGNQGGFFDPARRNEYGGQDARALGVTIYGRVPVAAAQPVAAFAPVQAVSPSGTHVAINRITFGVPLTPAQIAAIQPMQRIETSNAAGFFVAYVVRADLRDTNGTPLPIVAADGSSILVDLWSRPSPAVAPSPSVQPSSFDAGPYTVMIDTVHQIDQIYGGWVIGPDTLPYVKTAMSWEVVNYNNTPYVPDLANVLYDPRNGSYNNGRVLEGIDAGMTAGAGGTAFNANGDWLVGYSTENRPDAATPNKYGFSCPYAATTPTDGTGGYTYTCLYGGGIPGHGNFLDLQAYGTSGPNNPHTLTIDWAGNIHSMGQFQPQSIITPGLQISHSKVQLNSPAAGQVFQPPEYTGEVWVTGPAATLTLVFPPGPLDDQEFTVAGLGGYGGLTMAATDGSGFESDDTQSTTSASVAIAAHRMAIWKFNAALVVWQRKS